MRYFDLPRNYTMTDLLVAYKGAVKKYHPIKTKTSSHLYKINSEFAAKKSMLRMRDESFNFINESELERAICQCGHFYDMQMIDGDVIECAWCSIKVKITGRNRLS